MRVVSLVPSLTETLFALGLTERDVVGRTPWCIHPAECVDKIRVVGGTKTPRIHKIVALEPDLVVLDREENRIETYEALCAEGLRCWVAEVGSVADVPGMLEGLANEVNRPAKGAALATTLREALANDSDEGGSTGTAWQKGPRALPLIWHEPLMALAPCRYGGDLLRCAGWHVPDLPGETGYPTVSAEEIGRLGIEVLLLTSEPHDFTLAEGEAIAQAVVKAGFPKPRPVKVNGEALTWFGARTTDSLAYFRNLRRREAQGEPDGRSACREIGGRAPRSLEP